MARITIYHSVLSLLAVLTIFQQMVESFQTPPSTNAGTTTTTSVAVLRRRTTTHQPVPSVNNIRHHGFHNSNNNRRQQNNKAILNNNVVGPRLFLFGRKDEDGSTTATSAAEEGEEKIGSNDDNNNNNNGDDEGSEKKQSPVPFFSRFMGKSSNDNSQLETESDGSSTSGSTATEKKNSASGVATLDKDSIIKPPVVVQREEETPDTLKAKAERARLEAERMDAELTLMKIDKLTKQLSKAQTKGEAIDDLQRQLDDLQAKLRGEPPKPRPGPGSGPVGSAAASTSSPSSATTKETVSSSSSSFVTEPLPASSTTDESAKEEYKEKSNLLRSTQRELADSVDEYSAEDLKLLPGFILRIMAAVVEMDVVDSDADKIDIDELARRVNLLRVADYSFSNKPKPNFTQQQIDETVETIKTTGGKDMFTDVEKAKKLAGGNETQLALNYLMREYYTEKTIDEAMTNNPDKFLPKMFQGMIDFDIETDIFNASAIDFVIDRYYPKCTRKEGEEPTEAQADALMKMVLPAVKFSSSSKPQKVSGGYILRGSHRYEKGDDLIDAIDAELSKNAALDGKMTVLYAQDCTPYDPGLGELTFDEMMQNLEEEEKDPVLYVFGPDIIRDSNRLGLTVASILGIATSWYLSIYPFLLNDKIAQRVDEELALVDTGMQPDLSWLTDLSIPLFTTFLCLQAVHELAHRIVAATKGVKMSVPVFVPSLITGVTSTATTFKSLPKNREDMFDISASGPLFGIIASSITLAVGTKLTLVTDPSILPALPLEILRQSTLGGGIIEQIIPGSLYVPEGAPTNGIMISLHPVAIAGYISLIVNALSLLPIGTTDGGRLTMALFGREAKLGAGSNTLFLLLIYGLFGSDLFLFYFSYLLAFETGNEVPARNEVDEPDISRGVVAILCYGLAILSLVPFQ
eukprot:CAMPEP_0113507102 /NCGR_PEP_ID=MMETSP0014_2-20120614/36275_1 /TAXON_ID=2857 /ORGANISM="Nitzschia sp." /LENGTH=917 /DNA_ID=CAMNT_0000402667 /DNA_START=38 /DNA_END=2791 /DNA_ORIENTATION=+ /assembly_acc=CAM_ASM_000159